MKAVQVIPNLVDIESESQRILSVYKGKPMLLPFYTKDKLIEEAIKQLDGVILTEEERTRFYD